MRRAARYLTLLGPLAIVLGLSKVHAAWIANPAYDFTASFRLPWAITYAAALSLAAYGAGLPDLPRSARGTLVAAGIASTGAALTVSVLQLLVGDALLPRAVVLGSALLIIVAHLGVGWGARRGRSRDEGRDRILLVGPSAEAQRIIDELGHAPERPATLVGHLELAQAVDHDVANTRRPLIELLLAQRGSVVVLDRTAMVDERVVTQAASLHEAGIRVRTLVQFYEEWLGKLPSAELERASLFFDIGELHRSSYGRLKRLVDVGSGSVLLVALAVALPVVWVANRVANRGPLFYRQVRVGRGGVPFNILKFRTMVPTEGSGDAGPPGEWTTTDDPRITRFGKVLRRTHLDELPQAVNILRGDLSLVGPRPEQPQYVSELSDKLPFYGLRHLVRPGLTGWAQVKYGYAGNDADALEKLQYEFFYLRHQGLRFDARVMGRTVRSVLGGQGSGR